MLTIDFSDPDDFIHVDWGELEGPVTGKCQQPIGRLVHDAKISPVSCKMWGCPHCSRVKKYNTTKRFEHYCNPNTTYRMMTLTEWKHPSNYENAQQLAKHWNNLRASLRKHNVKVTDFFWVKEYKPLYNPNPNYTAEENALLYPHLHVLIPTYIDIKLLRRLWYLATGETANQVHIPEESDPALKNPAAYLTKYVTKADMRVGFHKKEKRFGFSRNYKAKPVSYMYLKNGQVKTFIPYISDKSTLFFLNSVKVPDEKLLQINEKYIYFRQEFWEKYPEEQAKFDSECEGLDAYSDILQEQHELLAEYILDININADYIISQLPQIKDNSILYAKERIKTYITDLANLELRNQYGFI